MRYDADIDSSAAQSGYTILKVFIWAMPIVGFIGTVIGIGAAVGGFSAFIQGVDDVEKLNELIKPALGGVTSGLSVAFDTTLLALVLAVPVMLFSSWVQKREDEVLIAMERYCVNEFLGKLETNGEKPAGPDLESPSSVRDIVEGLDRAAESIGEALRRATVDSESILSRVTENLATTVSELREWRLTLKESLNYANGVVENVDRIANGLSESAESFGRTAGGIAEAIGGAADRLRGTLQLQDEKASEVIAKLDAPRRIRIEALEVVETRNPEDGA